MERLRKLGTALSALVGLYGLGMTLGLLLHVTIDERLRPMMLFNSLLPASLFPALVLLPLALAFRRWRVVVTLLSPVIGLLVMYNYVFLPQSLPAAPAGTEISILTFNINLGNRDFEAVAQLIRAADADLVALQEINRAAYFYLDDDLADIYPYRTFHPDNAPPGQAVLSKYPILEDSYWQVERGHQRVVVEIDGQQVVFYNVHPVHFSLNRRALFNFDGQQREIDDILQRLGNEEGALIIAGDFNTSDQTDMYERFAALYGDTFRAVGAGFGLTFPSRLPLARLDYVFYNAAFIPLDAEVWYTNTGSDHFPLYVRLTLSNE
jgi:vancomycin resistance protein VanJ